jgi:predicted MFS family arabinose efflux permease
MSQDSEGKEDSRQESALKAIFTPTFIAISLINFFGMVAYYAAFLITTPFSLEKFQVSPAVAGLLSGIVVIGCLVARFLSGKIIQSASFIVVLVCGLVLFALTNLSYLFCSSVELLFAIRFTSGFAVGVIGTVTGTLVAVITPPKYQGRGISYFSMSTALSLCFGPFIGIAFLPFFGYRGVFLTTFCLSLVSLFLIFFIKVEKRAKPAKKKISLDDFVELSIVPLCLVIVLLCIAWGNIQAFIALYAKQNHVEAAASFFFLIYALAILLSRPYTGKIYDTQGPAVVFYPAMFSLAVGLLLLWAYPVEWVVLLSGLLIGFGFGNVQSVGQSSAISMVPRNRYAQATSTFYIFFDFSIGFAPYLSGFLVPSLGYKGVFGVSGLMTLLAVPLYFAVSRRMRNPSLGKVLPLKKKNE